MGARYTTTEAAKILGVNVSRVIQLCNRNQIVCEKVEGRWMIDKKSVDDRAANPPKAGRRWYTED